MGGLEGEKRQIISSLALLPVAIMLFGHIRIYEKFDNIAHILYDDRDVNYRLLEQRVPELDDWRQILPQDWEDAILLPTDEYSVYGMKNGIDGYLQVLTMPRPSYRFYDLEGVEADVRLMELHSMIAPALEDGTIYVDVSGRKKVAWFIYESHEGPVLYTVHGAPAGYYEMGYVPKDGSTIRSPDHKVEKELPLTR